MGRSQRLTLDHIRSVFRLLGEVTELGHDPLLWRARLMNGLCELTGAAVGASAEIRLTREQGLQGVYGMVDVGWENSADRATFYQFMQQGVYQDPVHPTARRRAGTSWTNLRNQFIDDKTWYAAPSVSGMRRQTHLDDLVNSHRTTIGPDWTHVVSLHRGWNDKPFESLQQKIVNLAHEELALLWKHKAGTAVELSPRQAEVLSLLRHGEGEKQVARALDISQNTVHGHVRELHRKYAATTRSELLMLSAQRLPKVQLVVASESSLPQPIPPRPPETVR